MTDDIGVEARRLMRACAQATLATLARPGSEGEGWPSPSLVLTAFAPDGSPLLLISALAEHTKNLEADPRCGLLFDSTGGHADRLTDPRLSVQGRAVRDDDSGLRHRFIARHPSATAYAGFRDFALWRLELLRGHLVAGFGRIHGLAADALRLDGADWMELAARQGDIIDHMNQDHADAVSLYATRLLGQPAGEWRLTGIDPDGCDLRAGEKMSARLDFGRCVRDADMARAELVRLVGAARRT